MLSGLFGNPRVIALFIAFICVAGLVAISSLPRLEDPHIANRFALVQTPFPGASAERVESLVSEPLERQLREISEIDKLNTTAKQGMSVLGIQLHDYVSGTEIARTWSRIKDKVDEVQPSLPAGVGDSLVETNRVFAFTWIAALEWQGNSSRENVDVLILSRWADELSNRLNNVDGTELVKRFGEAEEEVYVDLHPVLAASLGYDVNSVAEVLRQSDAKVSGGEIHNRDFRMSLEVTGAFDHVESVASTPLFSDESGVTVQLQDIAKVYRAETPMPSRLALKDGKRTVMVAVRMSASERGDRWIERISEKVEQFRQELPAEIILTEQFVQEEYNARRINELLDNMLLGFGFIVLVLLFTLGWRSAILVGLSLPLTVLFTLALMNLFGLPIHQMSLTGLIVALGIMVDNAIVLTDTVMRYRRKGFESVQAVTLAAKHLAIPLFASTLTTALTFLPIVLAPGPIGEFVGSLGAAVIFSILGSWFISIFLVAPIAGRWLTEDQRRGLGFDKLAQLFEKSLSRVLAYPRISIAVIFILPVSGFVCSQFLAEQFFPPSDRDMVNIEVYLPASASVKATEAATVEIESILREYSGIRSLAWSVGQSAPTFYYNLRDAMDGRQYYAQALIRFDSARIANQRVAQLQRKLREALPQYQVILRRLEQGPPSNSPVELRLFGNNLSVLQDFGEQLKSLALQTEGVSHVRNSLNEMVPKLWLEYDRSVAVTTQLSASALASATMSGLDGVSGGSVLEGTEQLQVRVRASSLQQQDLELFSVLPVLTPEGPSSLVSIAKPVVKPSLASISRRNGSRVNDIQIFLYDGENPAQVLERIKRRMNEQLALPPSVRLEIGGEKENRQDAIGNLMGSVGMITVLVILILVLAFNSFSYSGIILLVALQASGLGMFSLFVGHYPFGMTAIIGLMGLIGLSINSAIVILLELKESKRALAGDFQAVVSSVRSCLRHIASTTITTVVGLLPLLLSGGEFWPPFAAVLAGGTLLTSLLSLYFVPASFLLVAKRANKKLEPEKLAQQLN